jgi:hypothetical protein
VAEFQRSAFVSHSPEWRKFTRSWCSLVHSVRILLNGVQLQRYAGFLGSTHGCVHQRASTSANHHQNAANVCNA